MRVPTLRTFTFITLLALTGCNSIKVKVGARISLQKTPVTAIAVALSGDPGIAPGQRSGLIVTLTGPNGEILITEGKGHGKVLWNDLVVTPTIVTADKKGNILLPRDPRLTEGKLAHVTITVPTAPTLKADLDIPLRYDYPFTSRFTGNSGLSGSNGSDGLAGSSGATGSFDPDHPSPGGNGGNGTDGSDGQDGGRGGDGPPVRILLTLRPGPKSMLQAQVSAAGHQPRFYLIDPQGGSLTVSSDGGAGGSGGTAGHGGAGGLGGAGTPSGSNGSSGRDGRAGNQGFSGNPGPVSLTYDPSAQPFLSNLHLPQNATLNQASVPALW